MKKIETEALNLLRDLVSETTSKTQYNVHTTGYTEEHEFEYLTVDE